LPEILHRYDQVLIPELNTGQLRMLIRARFLVDAVGYSKVQGKPFSVAELVEQIERLLKSTNGAAAGSARAVESAIG
jgi:2-oxoglutarate ferredoxin oxidoreductase subunit alpha